MTVFVFYRLHFYGYSDILYEFHGNFLRNVKIRFSATRDRTWQQNLPFGYLGFYTTFENNMHLTAGGGRGNDPGIVPETKLKFTRYYVSYVTRLA